MNAYRLTLIGVCLVALALTETLCVNTPLGWFWPGTVWPVVLIIGLVFERWRYRPIETVVPANFSSTGERFEDPETGRVLEVYFDAASGERRYVDRTS